MDKGLDGSAGASPTLRVPSPIHSNASMEIWLDGDTLCWACGAVAGSHRATVAELAMYEALANSEANEVSAAKPQQDPPAEEKGKT